MEVSVFTLKLVFINKILIKYYKYIYIYACNYAIPSAIIVKIQLNDGCSVIITPNRSLQQKKEKKKEKKRKRLLLQLQETNLKRKRSARRLPLLITHHNKIARSGTNQLYPNDILPKPNSQYYRATSSKNLPFGLSCLLILAYIGYINR